MSAPIEPQDPNLPHLVAMFQKLDARGKVTLLAMLAAMVKLHA